jgi:hypothetical protein
VAAFVDGLTSSFSGFSEEGFDSSAGRGDAKKLKALDAAGAGSAAFSTGAEEVPLRKENPDAAAAGFSSSAAGAGVELKNENPLDDVAGAGAASTAFFSSLFAEAAPPFKSSPPNILQALPRSYPIKLTQEDLHHQKAACCIMVIHNNPRGLSTFQASRRSCNGPVRTTKGRVSTSRTTSEPVPTTWLRRADGNTHLISFVDAIDQKLKTTPSRDDDSACVLSVVRTTMTEQGVRKPPSNCRKIRHEISEEDGFARCHWFDY